MKSSTTALVFALVAAFSLAAADTDEIPAEGGTIAITPIMHGSVQVEFGGKVIQVDPWSDGDYSAAKGRRRNNSSRLGVTVPRASHEFIGADRRPALQVKPYYSLPGGCQSRGVMAL